ncbi:MAG: hypothetical protein ABW250_12835, partial [Pyrinomonadaceae bacterium]
MITCDRCQTENIEGSQYCDECGAALAGSGQSSGRRHVTEESAAAVAEPEPLVAETGVARHAPAELRPAPPPAAFASTGASFPARARGREDSQPPRRGPRRAPPPPRRQHPGGAGGH